MGYIKNLLISSLFLSSFLFGVTLTPKNFYKTINSPKITIVEFWASWCGPCSVLGPEFKEAAKQMGKKVTFATYNVDLGGKPLRDFNIQFLPTMVIFKNGKELDRKSEILSSLAIIEWIKEFK